MKIWSEGNVRCAILPLGVPINQKYNVGYNPKTKRASFFSSKKDNQFKSKIGKLKTLFLGQINPIPKLTKGKKSIDKNVIMQIEVYDIDNRRDIDAIEKSIQDAMNQVLYDDDWQIWSKNTVQYVDKENPRVVIKCYQEKRYK